jgi:hypothetical protein
VGDGMYTRLKQAEIRELHLHLLFRWNIYQRLSSFLHDISQTLLTKKYLLIIFSFQKKKRFEWFICQLLMCLG